MSIRPLASVAALAAALLTASAAAGQSATPHVVVMPPPVQPVPTTPVAPIPPVPTTPTPPITPVPPVPVTPGPATHPAQLSGWGRPLTVELPLRRYPNPALEPVATVPGIGQAGRLLALRVGADGQVWLRLAFPERRTGWAPAGEVTAVPAPLALSPEALRAIATARIGLGAGNAVVVRDSWGRTLLAEGANRPLVLASVTKLATMAAALERFPVDRATAARVLGNSDNQLAQNLSNRIGDGRAAAGARATVETAAALGANLQLVDGSGLGKRNRASAAEVADLLLAARERPWFPEFMRALPLAGRTGTLAGRMRASSAQSRVRAKTGTLFTPPVSTLAGYTWPAGVGLRADRALVVVILGNARHYALARPHQDAIMRALTARGALVTPGAASGGPGGAVQPASRR